MKKVQYHWELEVYRMSVEAAMLIFELSKKFPKEEIYSLTDQIRRSSREKKYQNALVNKLNESESEAAETQVWLEYAVKCKYLDRDIGGDLHRTYDNVIGKLVSMGNNPDPWLLKIKHP